MYHNIRDRADFYEKLSGYFDQLKKCEHDESYYSATLVLMTRLLSDYLDSRFSNRDELIKFLTYMKEKLRVSVNNNLPYDILFPVVNKCMTKIAELKILELTQSKSKKNLIIVPETRPGVHFVFALCSDLEGIGTTNQYSEYLDTIFPKSRIRDIVYYGTNSRFDIFKEKFIEKSKDIATVGTGFYFNPKPIRGTFNDLMPVLLDAQKPLADVKHDIFYFGHRIPKKRKWTDLFNIADNAKWSDTIEINKVDIYDGKINVDEPFVRKVINAIGNKERLTILEMNNVFTEVFKSMNFDSLRHSSNLYGGEEIVVFNPKQIFVLGTKLDVERFRQFVAEQKSQKSNTRTSLTA
jgi:hypothetical protein